MKKRALLVMAKRPFAGRTKTRLCPPFSLAQAAKLYECFLRDALDIVRAVPNITPFIAYAPAEEQAYFQQLAPDFERVPQIGATLGERLDFVLTHTLAAGFEQVAAINSDSPTLPAAYLAQAFAQLDDGAVDVVFGPCEDGGYYLIGWKRPLPRLVREVQMSTPHVLRDTLDIAQQEKLRVALLPTWYDVDTMADLDRVKANFANSSPDFGHYTRQFWLDFT
jgi:rSAM/selenodomain-associated transferase 1